MTMTKAEIEAFIYREARYLDDREFDRWLECYAPDCEFWMPAWLAPEAETSRAATTRPPTAKTGAAIDVVAGSNSSRDQAT